MSKDMLEGTLKQLRDALRQRREVLTDKALGAVDINLDRLPGLLHARCGYAGEQAEKEIALVLRNMGPEGKNPVEVVGETFSDSTPEEEAHVGK